MPGRLWHHFFHVDGRGDQRRQHHGREIFETAKRDRAWGTGIARQVRKTGKNALRLVDEAAPECGRRHRRPGPAQEQRLAKLPLQLGQGNRKRGLGDMQRLGRRGDAAGVGHGDRIFDLAQGDG